MWRVGKTSSVLQIVIDIISRSTAFQIDIISQSTAFHYPPSLSSWLFFDYIAVYIQVDLLIMIENISIFIGTLIKEKLFQCDFGLEWFWIYFTLQFLFFYLLNLVIIRYLILLMSLILLPFKERGPFINSVHFYLLIMIYRFIICKVWSSRKYAKMC